MIRAYLDGRVGLTKALSSSRVEYIRLIGQCGRRPKEDFLEIEGVFKIATTGSRVREYLTRKGWEFQGKDEEMEMDSYEDKRTGKRLCIEDISEDFPVTLLMGELSLVGFSNIARDLTPEIKLLEVDSSWEGRQTTIVVAMTEGQVENVFGKGTKMKRLPLHKVEAIRASKPGHRP